MCWVRLATWVNAVSRPQDSLRRRRSTDPHFRSSTIFRRNKMAQQTGEQKIILSLRGGSRGVCSCPKKIPPFEKCNLPPRAKPGSASHTSRCVHRLTVTRPNLNQHEAVVMDMGMETYAIPVQPASCFPWSRSMAQRLLDHVGVCVC